jgi:putative radical SAM enzyme (TIGR03279 family)
VAAVAPGSPAERAGIDDGDEVLALNGHPVRDVIEYARASDQPTVEVTLRRRGGGTEELRVEKEAGRPLGLEVASPVFDRVRTCDNHCSFCFIHQLPKGLRRSLYVKDDDYRLSFLYGNFTTLTRFTELDAERVLEERLSPLYVSIHATDPEVRSRLLRNPRGATSLRWLEVLLEHGIEVHGQVVVCPGVNDGPVLEGTLCDVLDRYPGLASVGVVPLGISRYTTEAELQPHSKRLATAVIATVERWQHTFLSLLGRRMVFCADEYYLLAGRPFPPASAYEGFVQHENGIGMARALIDAVTGPANASRPTKAGFFASVDGAPATGYRAPRVAGSSWSGRPPPSRPVAVITGLYGAAVLGPLLASVPEHRPEVRVLAVENRFFGGNISVAGLLTGGDVADALADQPPDHRYLLPDSCLSEGRFLDGTTLDDLPLDVEVVATDGASLARALHLEDAGGGCRPQGATR